MQQSTCLPPKKALFLDRDGVINVDHGYVCDKARCDFVAGIMDLLRHAKATGYFIVVVTNQSGIGRGYYTESMFHQFMAWMNRVLANKIDAYYFCPFHAVEGIGAYKRESFDRKPKPGMLLQAMRDHHIVPALSLMVGDKFSDIVAAKRAHIPRRYLLSDKKKVRSTEDYKVIGTLSEVMPYLCEE